VPLHLGEAAIPLQSRDKITYTNGNEVSYAEIATERRDQKKKAEYIQRRGVIEHVVSYSIRRVWHQDGKNVMLKENR
jgi:hypothetical protein